VYTNLKDDRPHIVNTGWAMLALIEAGQVHLGIFFVSRKLVITKLVFFFQLHFRDKVAEASLPVAPLFFYQKEEQHFN